MLTDDAIYIPVENQIVKYALEGNKTDPIALKRARVDLGTGAPVGNLFSDGKRIWVHGANRVYALGPDRSPSQQGKMKPANQKKAG